MRLAPNVRAMAVILCIRKCKEEENLVDQTYLGDWYYCNYSSFCCIHILKKSYINTYDRKRPCSNLLNESLLVHLYIYNELI